MYKKNFRYIFTLFFYCTIIHGLEDRIQIINPKNNTQKLLDLIYDQKYKDFTSNFNTIDSLCEAIIPGYKGYHMPAKNLSFLHLVMAINSHENKEIIKYICSYKEEQYTISTLSKHLEEGSFSSLSVPSTSFDVNSKNVFGDTALHLICSIKPINSIHFNANLSTLMLCDRLDFNIQNNCRETALHIACKNEYIGENNLKIIFEKTDCSIKDYKGRTPFDIATKRNNEIALKFFKIAKN